MSKIAYRISDLSEMYSIPESAFYKEIAEGRLRASIRDRKYLVLETEAQRWFNSLSKTRRQSRVRNKFRKFLRRLFRKRKSTKTETLG
jgi:hypothetical protein